MFIEKTKTYDNISLQELKEHLNVASDDNDYDSVLNRLIESAVNLVKKDIAEDIAATTGTTTEYCIYTSCYQISEPVTIVSISATTTTGSVSAISDYTVRKYSSYTEIIFDTGVNAETLQVVYTSGMSTIPEPLKSAIFIKVGELFNDRDGYINVNVRESKAYNRIIALYRNLVD